MSYDVLPRAFIEEVAACCLAAGLPFDPHPFMKRALPTPLLRVQRDAKIRSTLATSPALWTHDGEHPSAAHLRLLECAYTPQFEKVSRWLDTFEDEDEPEAA